MTSDVWNSFELVKVDGKDKSKCLKCGQTLYAYNSKTDTGNMLKHTKKCKTSADVGHMIMAQSSSSLFMKKQKFYLNTFREMIANAVIRHDFPFQFVKYEGIRDVFKYVCSDIKLVSRNTLKSYILKIFEREKKKIKEMMLANAERRKLGKMTKEEAMQLLDGLKNEEGNLNFVPVNDRNSEEPRRDW